MLRRVTLIFIGMSPWKLQGDPKHKKILSKTYEIEHTYKFNNNALKNTSRIEGYYNLFYLFILLR